MSEYTGETVELEVAKSATVSAAFTIPKYSLFCGALFPAMDNGNIGIEMTVDNSNYAPILDPGDGQDLLLCASGQDPAFIDFSDYVRFVPRHINRIKLRFTCAAQTTSAVTISTMFK